MFECNFILLGAMVISLMYVVYVVVVVARGTSNVDPNEQ